MYAIETGAAFITDDRGAHYFAGNPGQLGPGRVLDACQLTDAAVVEMYNTETALRDFHRAVAVAGREMRCNCVS